MPYKVKIKESSNKIEEEISLVRNGVKLQQLTLAKVDADIKSNVTNDKLLKAFISSLVLTLCDCRFMFFVVKIRELPTPERKLMSEVISERKLILVNPATSARILIFLSQ